MTPSRAVVPFAALTLTFAALGACSNEDSVFNAEVGECIESVSSLAGQISELPSVDCSEPHEGEVIFLFQHEGDDDDFPGVSEVTAEATEACTDDAFEDYTGTSYGESAIVVAPITPTEESWGDGDRESICIGALVGEEVTESFEGNGENYLLGDSSGGGDTGGGDPDEEAGDPTDPPDTDDENFADLAQACFEGSGTACDDLYFQTPVGSPEEDYGQTCGGRFDSPRAGGCAASIGD